MHFWLTIPSSMLDGMSIQQFVQYDKNTETNTAYVNLWCTTEGNGEVAKETLVVMAESLHQRWKIPLGYFLTRGLSGDVQMQISWDSP